MDPIIYGACRCLTSANQSGLKVKQVSKTVFLLKVFKSASLLWIEEYKMFCFIQVQLVLVVLVQVQDPLGVVSHETGGCKK